MDRGTAILFVSAITTAAGGALAQEPSTTSPPREAPTEASKIIGNGSPVASKIIGNGSPAVAGIIIGNGSPAVAEASEPPPVVEKAAASAQ